MRNTRPCGGCGRPLIPMQTCEHILNPSLPVRRPLLVPERDDNERENDQ